MSLPLGGIPSASLRDTDTNLTLNQQPYIAPSSGTFSGAQSGGAGIKCKGKKHSKCSQRTCIWTSKNYCRKKGKMNCRGKTARQCSGVKINIPGLRPPVVGRCKYIRGNVRSSCRRIRHYTRKARKTVRRRV
jgi:hypothetical protein